MNALQKRVSLALGVQANDHDRKTDINPTGMYSEVRLVTPELAREWLDTAPADWQRSLRLTRVKAYAAARAKGEWVLTHQGIAFDVEGRLRDGQHRLHMIVAAELPTILYVTYNVPAESFLHVDEQLPRSIADAISMAGQGNFESTAVSIARLLYNPPRVLDNLTGLPTAKETVTARLRLWSESIDFTEQHFPPKVTGLTRGVRTLVTRAHATMTSEAEIQRLAEFCRILRDGVPVSEHAQDDHAAIHYRNFLLSIRSGGASAEIEKYRKGQTAIEYFFARRRVEKLYGTERDLFPVPASKEEQ